MRKAQQQRRLFSKNGKIRAYSYWNEALRAEYEATREWFKFHNEGPRNIDVGPLHVDYRVGQLPDGRYMIEWQHTHGWGGGNASAIHDTRPKALRAMLHDCVRYFDPDSRRAGEWSKADRAAAPRMRARLMPSDLFGFEEPEPVPFHVWIQEELEFEVGNMATVRGWELIDVVRGGDYRPVSKAKDGSFWEIPLPWEPKKKRNRYNAEADTPAPHAALRE